MKRGMTAGRDHPEALFHAGPRKPIHDCQTVYDIHEVNLSAKRREPGQQGEVNVRKAANDHCEQYK